MEPLKDIFARKRQFILYCLIGGTGVTLDFLVYSALVGAAQWHVQYANAVGYASGTVLSFILNARYNFKTSDRLAIRFLCFCVVALLGWMASAGVLYLLVNRFGLDKYLAKLATIVVVVMVQYNLNRLLSFRKIESPSNG